MTKIGKVGCCDESQTYSLFLHKIQDSLHLQSISFKVNHGTVL